MAKDNICVIYDDDESYAKRLMGIINDSKDIPYRAKVFTKEEEFNRYILANKTHMALIMRILRQMITALLFCVKMRKKQELLMIRKRKGLSVCANTSQLTSF